MAEILYYEKLDMPITELENKKPVTVSWVTPKLTEEGPHKLLVNKTDNVEQLLEVVRTKVKSTPAPVTRKLRLVEVFNNRVSKVYENNEPVKSLNDYSTLYAEDIPADQLHVAEEDQLVNCFHYHKDPYSSHGIPFLFLLKAVSYSSFMNFLMSN